MQGSVDVHLQSSIETMRTDCPQCAAPVKVGMLPSVLTEASGLAASHSHPGKYYAVQDSPVFPPQAYVILENGTVVQTLNLTSVEMNEPFGTGGYGDWEAAAVGPCEPVDVGDGGGEQKSCVFIGDIGHNCARMNCSWHRDVYALLRFEEPSGPLDGPGAFTEVRAERFEFRFPGAAAPDAEGLMVTPRGAIFVTSKLLGGRTDVYRFPPLDSSRVVNVTRVGSVEAPTNKTFFTGASVHERAGSAVGFSLRTYHHVLYWRLRNTSGGEEDVGEALRHEPCKLPSKIMHQSETVTWEYNSESYLLTSEAQPGIFKVTCAVPDDD